MNCEWSKFTKTTYEFTKTYWFKKMYQLVLKMNIEALALML